MKKTAILLMVFLCVSLFSACGKEANIAESSPPITPSHTQQAKAEEAQAAEREEVYDKIPMVMVNGKLYYDTGKESPFKLRCGVMDGKITSAVDGTKIPKEDRQSNFGTGYEYQYGEGNTIEICMNEKWIVFEQRDGDGSTG